MRKKYLSALLFGALLFASAGTFTSCKDYDDDIDNLQSQITDVKNAVTELQKKIADLKYVSSVASEGNGLKITWNDGTSTTINNVINEKMPEIPTPGDVITFDDETGEILINGKGSGYYALVEGEIEEVKVPYVNNDGFLVLIDKDGNELVTNITVAPVSAIKNADGSYTITILCNGEKQEVVVPSAASALSGIELMDDKFKEVNTANTIELLYWNAKATSQWKGPRGNIPANITTYSTNGQTLYTRITPSSVDASEISFNLVDTKDNVMPVELAAKMYDGILTRASNGLYTMTITPGSYADGGSASKFADSFKTDTNGDRINDANRALALKPTTGNFKSAFNVKVNPSLTTDKDLGDVKFGDTDVAGVGDEVTSVPSGARQVKVGQKVTISVSKSYNLYDMYLSATAEDIALFGLEFSEDGRSFKATKSPDNVTDATIDLLVHTLPNAGDNDNIKTTTIRVEINRTMGEGTYALQTVLPTKVDDTFLVSADKLKESLGSDLNAWYASVKHDVVSVALYNDEALTSGADVTADQLSVSLNKDKDHPVTEANIGSALNYLKFTLDIKKNTSGTEKPLKIDKTYYALLTFKDKTSLKSLNTIVVPIKLTKPELSEILVKESGVFRDAENADLAYAYMYAGDKEDNGSGYARSRYYFDRAFTDLKTKLTKNGINTTLSWKADDANNVTGTDKKTSQLATVYNVGGLPGRSGCIGLTNTDSNSDGIRDGYKKDLNVKFTANYLDVKDASYKYEHTYQFRVMSPILEGVAVAANNLVEVSATGKTKIYKEDIWAKTYNGDVKYDIFKEFDADGNVVWTRNDIKKVEFSTGNPNVFEVTVATPKDPVAATATTAAVPSYVEVEGVSANTAKLNVAITDIWGYTLKSQVDIKTTLNTGNN